MASSLSRSAALGALVGAACIGATMAALAATAARPLSAPPSSRLEIGQLTWVEVRDDVRRGMRTALVPSGGNEQNGVHMAIGKHDEIVAAAARETAARLGDALVAPVIAYVPEGDVDRREGHYAFPGTLGVTPQAYAETLEGAARSLKAAGFTTICFMADHGGSAPVQAEVARRLGAQWAHEGVRVVDVSDYYAAGSDRQVTWLKAHGWTDAAIGAHAGVQDTSELLAVRPDDVALDRLAGARGRLEATGALGDPGRATAALGRTLLEMRVSAAVDQIRRARASDAKGASRA